MADKDQEAGGGASLGLTHIDVNLDGLAAFRSLLHREIDVNLKPGVARITNQHMHGPGFGLTTRSTPVQAARTAYGEALAASMDVLNRYVQLARALVDGIHEISSNYRTSDITDAELMTLLTDKLITVQTSDNAIAAAADAREAHRETHRAAWTGA